LKEDMFMNNIFSFFLLQARKKELKDGSSQ
jgi:hypothetical protein